MVEVPSARPHGPARVLGHVERRADLDPAVRVHGLPRRTREPDREAVPQPAPGAHAHPRLARRGHAGDVRGVRDRDGHRRRRGDVDGAARAAGDAARRVQREDLGGRDHGRRLLRHPDPAVGHADRVRRHGGRIGGQAVRRRLLPGDHAGGPLHRLRDGHGEAEAVADAAAGGKRAHGQLARAPCHRRLHREHERAAGPHRRAQGRANAGVPASRLLRDLFVAVLPAVVFAVLMGLTWHALTKPNVLTDTSQLEQMGDAATGLVDPSEGGDSAMAREQTGLAEPPSEDAKDAPAAPVAKPAPSGAAKPAAAAKPTVEWQRIPAPTAFWYVLGIGTAALVFFYAIFTSCASRSSRCCWRRSSRLR